MDPGAEALAEVDLQPPDERTELLLLVRLQLHDLVLAGGQLLLVVGELAHKELLLAGVQLELVSDLLEQRHRVQAELSVGGDHLGGPGHDHVRQLLVVRLPILLGGPGENTKYFVNLISYPSSVNYSLGHDDQESGQVLRVQDEVLLLDDVSQAASHQTAALLLLQVLEVALQAVVGRGLGLEVRVDLANLLGDDVGDVAQRLLDGVLRDVPLETRQVRGQVIYKGWWDY